MTRLFVKVSPINQVNMRVFPSLRDKIFVVQLEGDSRSMSCNVFLGSLLCRKSMKTSL